MKWYLICASNYYFFVWGEDNSRISFLLFKSAIRNYKLIICNLFSKFSMNDCYSFHNWSKKILILLINNYWEKTKHYLKVKFLIKKEKKGIKEIKKRSKENLLKIFVYMLHFNGRNKFHKFAKANLKIFSILAIRKNKSKFLHKPLWKDLKTKNLIYEFGKVRGNSQKFISY